MDIPRRSKTVKQVALELGFHAVGITSAGPIERADSYRRWLDDGMAGQMHYLHRHMAKRMTPALLMPQVKSIICLGLNYFNPSNLSLASDVGQHVGKVAMYAWGRDNNICILAGIGWIRII